MVVFIVIFVGGLYPLLFKDEPETIQMDHCFSFIPDSFGFIVTFNSDYEFKETKSSQFTDFENI